MLVLALALSPPAAAVAQTLASSAQANSASFGDAVASPLRDANLVRSDIPDRLEAVAKAPYLPPTDLSCSGISEEVETLDAVLGPDYGAPTASDAQGRPVFGAVASVVTSLVPMRGLLRKVSGADRHDQQVREALRAGFTRRGYLKGMADAMGCDRTAVLVAAAPARAAAPVMVSAREDTGSAKAR